MDYTEARYRALDVQYRTFVRQLLVDVILLIQNIVMIVLAKNTVTSSTAFSHAYDVISVVIGVSYVLSMLIKLLFYLYCHPWASIIRPEPGRWQTSVMILSKERSINLE